VRGRTLIEREATATAEPSPQPPVATAETDRLGVIRALDAAGARLLNCEPGQASGSLLMGFIDPVSQREYLEAMFRARRTSGVLTSRLFLRPRRRLPVRCEARVRPVRAGEGALQWSFRPEPEAAGAIVGAPIARVVASAAAQGREEAARRFSRDLHDDAGQLLAALHLAIDAAAHDLPDPARARVLSMRELVRSVEEQLRLISHQARMPALEQIGLASALEVLGQSTALRRGTRVVVKATCRTRLAPSSEAHLYRIAQEAITNAVRHGRPRRIAVRLQKCGDKILLSVVDDGQGFDLAEALAVRTDRGIGLIGIQERVEAIEGTLSMESSPGKGTTITVMAPLWQ
jgi:signal transduction histidine kinase